MATLHTYSVAQLLNLITGQIVEDYAFHLGYFTGEDRVLPYPYRVQGYAIGLATSGWLRGSINLDTFQVNPGQLMVIAPQQIHRILSCSTDFTMRSLFFTDAFLSTVARGSAQRVTLDLFHSTARAVLDLSQEDAKRINALLDVIEDYYWPIRPGFKVSTGYIVQAILTDLNRMYEESGSSKSPPIPLNRPTELANRFRQLVTQQYLTTRNVSAYADQLAVSAKHLSETVKLQTGQPASAWIDAMVIQEAQVLLSQTTSSLSQIADYLQFGTQSAFGKFFRQKIGLSPREYRNNRS